MVCGRQSKQIHQPLSPVLSTSSTEQVDHVRLDNKRTSVSIRTGSSKQRKPSLIAAKNASQGATTKAASELLWNTALFAYDFDFPKEPRVITVKSFTKKNENQTVPNITELMSESYRSPVGDEREEALIVGVRPSSADQFTSKEKQKDRAPKGSSVSGLRNYTVLPNDLDTKLVVVRLGLHSQTQYFQLCNPDGAGLCETVLTDLETVFFPAQFRDDDVQTQEGRKNKWPSKIRKCLVGLTYESTEGRARTMQLGVDQYRLSVKGNRETDDGNPQESVESLLRIPTLKHVALWRLVSINNDFDEVMAKKAVKEAVIDDTVSVKALLKLGTLLRDTMTEIPFSILKLVIVLFRARFQTIDGVEDEEVAGSLLLDDVISRSKAIVGPITRVPRGITDDDTTNALRGLSGYIEGILEQSEREGEVIRAEAGSHLMGAGSLAETFAKLAESPEVDSARTWGMQAYRIY
ncbi:MAG: hypothetical protein M1828_003650 [Chrysothrix sp. TS-e1954]|nr:MAG: hypothetical protein M1828_003650 [Chrysothrix sp. TS-e1954]